MTVMLKRPQETKPGYPVSVVISISESKQEAGCEYLGWSPSISCLRFPSSGRPPVHARNQKVLLDPFLPSGGKHVQPATKFSGGKHVQPATTTEPAL